MDAAASMLSTGEKKALQCKAFLDLGRQLEPPHYFRKRDRGKGGASSYQLQTESQITQSRTVKKPRKITSRPRMPAPTNNPCRSQPAGDSASPNNKNPKAELKTHSHQTAKQCPPTHHNSCGSCGSCGSCESCESCESCGSCGSRACPR